MSGTHDAAEAPEPLSLGREAAKLVAVLQERLDDASPSCRGCPACIAMARLQHVPPESVERVVDAGAAFVNAVREFVASTAGAARRRGENSERGAQTQWH